MEHERHERRGEAHPHREEARPPQQRRRRKRRKGNAGFIIGTILLIGVVTCAMFAGIFLTYVKTTLAPTLDVDIDDYNMSQSTIVYYTDKETGEDVELETLKAKENRILVDYDQLPDAMWQAAVAVEDKRFFEHHGVDWQRTIGATVNMFFKQRNTYGGGAKLIYDTRKLQLTSDLQVGFTDTKDSPYGNFSTYTQLLPIFRIKDSNGDYFPTLSANNIPLYENFPWTGIGSDVLGSQINPLYEANNLNNFSRGNNLSLTYQLGANWEIVKDLRLRASFTYDRMESMTEKYVSPFSSAITDGLENNSVEQLYRRGSYDKQNTTTSKYYGMVNLSYLILTGLLNPFGVSVAAAAGIGVLLMLFPYASGRINTWRDPFSSSSDEGYQIVQSLYTIGSGGLSGLGLGMSRQKYLYLPEEHNDFIFSVVCEELGFIGAALILLLFALLILRGYWIALHCRDRFSFLVVAGITTLLAIQVFLNVAVVTNLVPCTGISLPFFSYGGTALLIQLGEMGIILSASRDVIEK